MDPCIKCGGSRFRTRKQKDASVAGVTAARSRFPLGTLLAALAACASGRAPGPAAASDRVAATAAASDRTTAPASGPDSPATVALATVPATVPRPGQGQPCDQAGRCPTGLTCLRYLGVAGPAGGTLTSCEIPCSAAGAVCPAGQRCVTIADGPGAVCRPRE